jgi:hypothetical protein
VDHSFSASANDDPDQWLGDLINRDKIDLQRHLQNYTKSGSTYMMELLDILQLLLPLAVIASTALTIFIATLPQIYDPSAPREFQESDFSEEDKKNAEKSGYASYQAHKDSDGIFRAHRSSRRQGSDYWLCGLGCPP